MGCYSESARGTKKNTDLNIPQIKTITTFRTTSNPFQHEVCQNTIAQKIPKLQIHCSNNINVVQLLTYGPFYKNAATRGPLPIEWCNLYNNGFPTVQIKKEKTSECVTESVWVFETIANSNIITNLYQWDACGQGFSATIVQCFASRWISVFRFDCFIIDNVLSHILLIDFQLSGLTKTVIIAHF